MLKVYGMQSIGKQSEVTGMCCRLKKQILDIQEGKLFRAACISPDPCNSELGHDVKRLVEAVLEHRVQSLDLQAGPPRPLETIFFLLHMLLENL